MKLLTKAIAKDLQKSQKSVKDPIIKARWFNPTGAGNWFGIEIDKDEDMVFGYVSIFGDWNDELGYFTLSELASYKGPFGLGIERDLYWEPTPLSEVEKQYTRYKK